MLAFLIGEVEIEVGSADIGEEIVQALIGSFLDGLNYLTADVVLLESFKNRISINPRHFRTASTDPSEEGLKR